MASEMIIAKTPSTFSSGQSLSKKYLWIPWVFVLIFFGMGLVSRLFYQPKSGNFTIQPPTLTSGDEPHYLIVVNSLLFDGDLELQEDYQRVRRGGLEAGKRFQGRNLDHHTYLVDTRTGDRSLWPEIFGARSPVPCQTADCVGFRRKSPRFSQSSFVIEKSSHPAAYPVILAAILAPTFPHLDQVERRVSWVIVIFSWITLVVIYSVARRVDLSPLVSVVAVLMLVLASPWLAYSRSYFSEPLIGLILAIGLWSMQRNRIILAGLMVILAMAVKLPFALVGLGWIIERLAAKRIHSAMTLACLLFLGSAVLMAFNHWQVGIPIVSGSAGFVKMWKFPNPLRTLLDIHHGLFLFAPWALIAWVGMFLSLKGESTGRNAMLRQIALPSFLFWILLSFHGPLGGSAYGPRYWVPFLPWFALAATMMAERMSGKLWRILTPLVLAGALVAVPGALIYPHSWDSPPHSALQRLMIGTFPSLNNGESKTIRQNPLSEKRTERTVPPAKTAI